MNTVIPHLKELLNSVDVSNIPYQKGNNIYIGRSCVRKVKYGYKTFYNKKFVAETFSKVAAITLAKLSNTHEDKLFQIKKLDNIIHKNFNDCLFYKNASKKSKDSLAQSVLDVRIDVSTAKIDNAVSELLDILHTN